MRSLRKFRVNLYRRMPRLLSARATLGPFRTTVEQNPRLKEVEPPYLLASAKNVLRVRGRRARGWIDSPRLAHGRILVGARRALPYLEESGRKGKHEARRAKESGVPA